MVAHAHLHEVRWLAPQPMWGQSPDAANGAPARPAILRFASDAFMEELIAAMETRPEQLPAWLARPETWRAPMPVRTTSRAKLVIEPVFLKSCAIRAVASA